MGWQKFLKLIITLSLLVGGLALAYFWQAELLHSARTYRSISTTSLPFSNATIKPLATQVVLVIISGLGYDTALTLDLPTLSRLQEVGASALVESQPPSDDEPAWLALISGSQPAFNNAPRLSLNQSVQTASLPPKVETIFHVSQKRGLNTALLGQDNWQAILSLNLATKLSLTSIEDERGDWQLLEALDEILDDEKISFFLIQFSQVDFAGHHLGGTESQAYRSSVQTIDRYLALLISRLDLARTTLIITSDHGHLVSGGHGGHDLPILRQPLIMAGKGIIPGIYSAINQVDIAPTMTTLLGLPILAQNQGRPLIEMLHLSERDQTIVMLNLAQQRLHFNETYLNTLSLTPPDMGELEKVFKFFEEGNLRGTRELAQLLIDESNTWTEQSILLDQTQRQRMRIVIALIIIFGGLIFIVWQRTALMVYALFAACMVLITYHGLYRLAGHSYSFSVITQLDQFYMQSLYRIGASVFIGTCIYLALLMLKQSTKNTLVFLSSYEFVLFITLGFLTPALYGFWQYGAVITHYFPDMRLLFLYWTALIHSICATLITLLLPFIIVPLNLFVQRFIAVYQRRQLVKLQARRSAYY